MSDIIKSFDLEIILRNIKLIVDNPPRFIRDWKNIYDVEKVIQLYKCNSPDSTTLSLLETDLVITLDEIWDNLK